MSSRKIFRTINRQRERSLLFISIFIMITLTMIEISFWYFLALFMFNIFLIIGIKKKQLLIIIDEAINKFEKYLQRAVSRRK